jgi:endonuclease-3
MATKAKTKSKKKTKSKTKAKSKAKAKTKSKTGVGAKSKSKSATGADPTVAMKRQAQAILHGLQKEHPDAHCELDFTNGLELLIGTILAAQCTDARVNIVTAELFKKYKNAQDFVDTPSEVLEEEIRSTGFYRNKTKSIKKCCQSLVEQYNGQVPDTMDELIELAGVGRKTANCILGNVFKIPGIVVDTHMLRISKRMGFTDNTDPTKVEFDLRALFPDSDWISLSHLIPWHGRRVCKARNPACETCAINNVCPQLL